MKDKRKILLIANPGEKPAETELEIAGAEIRNPEILRIDGIYRYAPTGERIRGGKLVLPPYSCTEIRLQ